MLDGGLTSLAFVLLVLAFYLGLPRLFPPEPTSAFEKIASAKSPRPLRPRTPDDCPACREASIAPNPSPNAPPPIRPWHEIRSRRGHPKLIETEGFACLNPNCDYHGDTAAKHHALVGYGHHRRDDPIQDLFCQSFDSAQDANTSSPCAAPLRCTG